MKKRKKFLTVVGLASIVLPSVFFMTACSCGNDEPTTPHTHNFSQTWTYDDDNHFHKCEGEGCNEISDNAVHNHSIVSAGNETQHKLSCACGHYIYAPHTGGQATCQEKAVCEVCQTEYGDFAGHTPLTAFEYNETHHWHECSIEGCDNKLGEAEHNHSGVSQYSQTQHKKTCECGHFEYVGHNFGAWVADPANATQHKKTCDDCGYVVRENHLGGTATCQEKAICDDCGAEYGNFAGHNHATAWSSDATHHWHVCQTAGCTDKGDYANHTFANGIEDCVCGAHAPVEEVSLISKSGHYEWNSSTLQAQTGKFYAYKFESSSDLWYHRVLSVAVNKGDSTTKILNANIKLYDETKSPVNGENTFDIQSNSTYYVVVELTSLEEWGASNSEKTISIYFDEREDVTQIYMTSKLNNTSNQYFRLSTVSASLPTGTTIFMRPTADGQLVDKYGISVAKENIEEQRFDELLFVPTEYCSYVVNEGIYLTVEKGAKYYFKLNPTTYHATQFDLENIRIVEDATIATSTHNQVKRITLNDEEGYGAEESFAFKYVVNNVQNSDLSINVCDSSGDSFHLNGNGDAYQLNVLLDEHGVTNISLYKNITNKFVNDGGVWEYTGTDNLAGKTLIIFITLKEAQEMFYVDLYQKDTILVTRNLNGGTLEGSETPLELEYGKDYSSAPMNFGIPTKGDLDFYGWCLGNEDGFTIIGVNGQYEGTWQNNPSYQAYDWYGNGEVTVYASFLTANRIVTLNPNGGKWADDSTSNKPSVQITSGQVIADIPTKEGYTFIGYSVTVGGNKLYCAFGDGVAVDISKLINRTNNAYTLTAEWATTLASCAETVTINSSALGQFAFTTGNWTLPAEQTTAPTRIELANVNTANYSVFVTDNQGNSISNIGNNEFIFDLAPSTQYFIYISGNGTTHTNKKLVITRDLVRYETEFSTSYELKGINVQANEKVVLRANQAYMGTYWLTITQLTSSAISAENIISVKLLDSSMQELNTITQSPSVQGQYVLGSLTPNTVYYVEIVFARDLIKVNFALQ